MRKDFQKVHVGRTHDLLQFLVLRFRSIFKFIPDLFVVCIDFHLMAGFRVLKAPDVPSVLVELGYMSNADEELNLAKVERMAIDMALRI